MKLLYFVLIASLSLSADTLTDKFSKKFSELTSITSKSNPILPKEINWHSVLPPVSENPDFSFKISKKTDYLTKEFLEDIERGLCIDTCIELRTFTGETTNILSTIFKTVYSLESRKTFFENAKQRFKKNNNVFLYNGNSAEHLPSILKKTPSRTLVIINTPYNYSDITSPKSLLLKELTLIKQSGQTPIILMDDVRLLYDSKKNSHLKLLYPSLETVISHLLEINPTYQIAIIYDTLLAFPSQYNLTVSSVVQAATISRIYNEKSFDDQEILEAELAIAHAQKEEQEALLELGKIWIESWTKPFGMSYHLPLWVGLITLNYDQFPTAYAYLKEAKERGLTHWRIDWYLSLAESRSFFNIKKSISKQTS